MFRFDPLSSRADGAISQDAHYGDEIGLARMEKKTSRTHRFQQESSLRLPPSGLVRGRTCLARKRSQEFA